jgi:hypothetical protein
MKQMNAPLYVSNHRWALDHSKERAAMVDSEALWGATLDASRIAFVLMMHLGLGDEEHGDEITKMIEDELARPWRYTPRAPAKTRSSNRRPKKP